MNRLSRAGRFRAPASILRQSDHANPAHLQPLQSMLSQVYGKPVELKLTSIQQPHHDAQILAQRIVQNLQDRKVSPRSVLLNAANKPSKLSEDQVKRLEQERLREDARRKPITLESLTFANVHSTKTPAILRDLRLSQVSNIKAEVKGRLTARLSADQASRKTVRSGASNKAETRWMRGVQKTTMTSAQASGKRRIGSYGASVTLGHA